MEGNLTGDFDWVLILEPSLTSFSRLEEPFLRLFIT
jgi:hypothetical protein